MEGSAPSGFLSYASASFLLKYKPRVGFSQLTPTVIYRDPFSYSSNLLRLIGSRGPVSCSSSSDHNGSALTFSSSGSARVGEVKRVTKETNVSVKINLDGSGISDSSTGIPFLDHMVDQLASHGLFNVHVKATGDVHIDDHHTNEDVALAIGTVQYKAYALHSSWCVLCDKRPFYLLIYTSDVVWVYTGDNFLVF